MVGQKHAFETSHYSTIHDLFESHLATTLKDSGAQWYRVNVGDRLKIKPTQWAIKFSKGKGQELPSGYEFEYIVRDIQIDYYKRNFTVVEGNFPLVKITIYLERA